MIRGRFLFAAALTMLLAPTAQATTYTPWTDITFTAPVPCSFVCPYWLDALNHDIDGNEKDDIYFQACASPDGTADALEDAPGLPFMEGTVYDDVVVGPVPEGFRVLEAEIRSVIDWDGFFCDPETGEELGSMANLLAEECTPPVPTNAVPLGCRDSGSIVVEPGKTYIIRAYNWSDHAPARGRYRFIAP